MTKLPAETSYAGLVELARLGTTEAPQAQLAEQAGALLLRVTGATAIRLSIDVGGARHVLFASWPDPADAWPSRLSLPMVAGGRTVGMVECAAPREGGFDPTVRQFVDSAAQVLARLLGFSPTDLSQNVLELRTLQRVAEAVSRSLELEEVLGRCLEMALQVAHAPAGVIYLRDGQRGVFRRVQSRHIPDEVAPLELPTKAVDGRFALERSAVVVDVDNLVERVPVLEGARRHGFKRVVLLPLRVEERLVGVLGLDYFTSSAFLPSTIMTLEAIARQEAIAIENARAHRQSELRTRVAQVLRRFAERALSLLDDTDIYKWVLECACELTRSDRGLISRLAPGADAIHVVCAVGRDASLMGMTISPDEPYVRASLERTQPLIVEDTSELEPDSVFAKVAAGFGTQSLLLYTMRYRGKPLGHLFTGSGEVRRYESAEIEAMDLLATMSAEVLERARVQREAESERRRLDAIIDHMPIVMAVIDQTGAVTSINRAGREFAIRYGGDGASDAHWTQGLTRVRTLDTDGKPIPFEELQVVRAFRGEHPRARELLLTDQQGQKRMYVLAVAAPLFDDKGMVTQVVTAFQDVSALRELADAKDRFLRVASHELRSPITSLRATTSLLEMDPAAVADPGRRAVMLQRIHRQVDRLIKLVEQLLDSARLNADQVPIQPAECEMGQLVDEAIALAASSPADRNRVTVERPGPVRGAWDPLRIEQVLTNLIANALRYSTHSVVVRLTDEDPVRIEVIDEGIGIPPNQIDQVFSPFFRAANAQAQYKGGLGLGLHITAEIVRRHGGRIAVQSELGRGSTFTVELPRRRT